MITTIAGTGTAGFELGDGTATGAQLNGPRGIAVNSAGVVYVADSENDRILALTPMPR
jgi:DNA-binding beta-propeller fold protein YncE